MIWDATKGRSVSGALRNQCDGIHVSAGAWLVLLQVHCCCFERWLYGTFADVRPLCFDLNWFVKDHIRFESWCPECANRTDILRSTEWRARILNSEVFSISYASVLVPYDLLVHVCVVLCNFVLESDSMSFLLWPLMQTGLSNQLFSVLISRVSNLLCWRRLSIEEHKCLPVLESGCCARC